MNEEKILKLIKSANRDDLIIGLHMLKDYSEIEIKDFFDKYSDVYTQNNPFYRKCIQLNSLRETCFFKASSFRLYTGFRLYLVISGDFFTKKDIIL